MKIAACVIYRRGDVKLLSVHDLLRAAEKRGSPLLVSLNYIIIFAEKQTYFLSMSFVWLLIMLASVTVLLFTDPSAALEAMITGANDSVTLALNLVALYGIWLGCVRNPRIHGSVGQTRARAAAGGAAAVQGRERGNGKIHFHEHKRQSARAGQRRHAHGHRRGRKHEAVRKGREEGRRRT